MPNNQSRDDDSEYRLPKKLLEEGPGSNYAEQVEKLSQESQLRELDKARIEQLREQVDSKRWKLNLNISVIGITFAITAVFTFVMTNWANSFTDLRSELSEVRERLEFLETIHSDKHFRPVHVHPTGPTDEPVNESGPPAQGK